MREFTTLQTISQIETLLAAHLPAPEFDSWPGWNLLLEMKDDLEFLANSGVTLPRSRNLPFDVSPRMLKTLWFIRGSVIREWRTAPGKITRDTAARFIATITQVYKMLEETIK